MNQRNVIITGSHGELGQAVTAYLSKRGWNVIGWTREEVDLRDSQATQLAFESVKCPVHAVVHTVGGILAGKPLAETSDHDFDAMIDLNLRTAYNVLRASVPLLTPTHGAIVTIAAMAAHQPSPRKSLYAASKAGVVAITQAVAEECRQSHVRAVCVSPGTMNTHSNQAWSTPEERVDWISPEQIAEVIEQIIDPQSQQTGIVVVLDNSQSPQFDRMRNE